MSNISVYTDGSGTTATKAGGWAYVLVVDGSAVCEGYGHLELASNNDCELEAAIMGLAAALRYKLANKHVEIIVKVTLISDSQIVLNWANGTNKFKQEHKMPKYQKLMALMGRLNAKTEWVRGHSGNEFNERCDKLANLARKGIEENVHPESTNVRKKCTTLRELRKSGILTIEYKGKIKVIDLNKNTVEDK